MSAALHVLLMNMAQEFVVKTLVHRLQTTKPTKILSLKILLVIYHTHSYIHMYSISITNNNLRKTVRTPYGLHGNYVTDLFGSEDSRYPQLSLHMVSHSDRSHPLRRPPPPHGPALELGQRHSWQMEALTRTSSTAQRDITQGKMEALVQVGSENLRRGRFRSESRDVRVWYGTLPGDAGRVTGRGVNGDDCATVVVVEADRVCGALLQREGDVANDEGGIWFTIALRFGNVLTAPGC